MPSVRRRIASRVCVNLVVTGLGIVGTHAFFAASPASPIRRPAAAAAAAAPAAPAAVLTSRGSRWATRLHGVREWKQGQPDSTREIGFLPFPVDDVMCPGETKALHLYEARFLSLFENAIKNHGGCVGGAIFVDDGVLVRVGQLCDIIAWEREEVGVSVALRCVGRCEISDVTNVDPYICATVREVRDLVGVDDPDEEGERNDVVSSDVFSLHRQCVELERKMAIAAGGNIGWESGSVAGKQQQQQQQQQQQRKQESSRRIGAGDTSSQSYDAKVKYEGADGGGPGDESITDDAGAGVAPAPVEGDGSADADDLMAKFQLGGGELDLSQLDGDRGVGNDEEDRASSAAAVAAKVDSFAVDDDDDEEDDEEDEEEGGSGTVKRGLEDLLWGHETYESDGFDSSLEEQVEAMYDSLKADLSVTLEEGRGGADATAFGAPNDNGGRDKPWGAGGGNPETIADVFAAASSAAAATGNRPSGVGGEGGEGEYLWGCRTPQEEREQLVSFVSLGCFDPTARLQSLMLLSTGERLRMARDALAERLKVLVAKSALSQLGD